MKIYILTLVIVLTGCNSFIKKDSHPEVPNLKEILADETKFQKISEKTSALSFYFLKDDRILILPYVGRYSDGPAPLKIINTENQPIIELIYKDGFPLYIDSSGNLYYENKKYYYPDLQKSVYFEMVLVKDSLDNQLNKLEEQYRNQDSLLQKLQSSYEREFLKKYGLTPCEFKSMKDNCDVYEIRENKLIIWQDELFKNEFSKETEPITEFDKPKLIRYNKGAGQFGLPFPVYLKYYTIGNNYKFKEDKFSDPVKVKLKGNIYLYSEEYGLYLVKLGQTH